MDDFMHDCPPRTGDNTQFLKLAIVLVFLAGYMAMALLPSFGMKPVDAAFSDNAKNIMLLIVGFFFGSSSSSAKKDDTIAAQVTQAAK